MVVLCGFGGKPRHLGVHSCCLRKNFGVENSNPTNNNKLCCTTRSMESMNLLPSDTAHKFFKFGALELELTYLYFSLFQEHKYFEDAFKVYERGVKIFKYPHAKDIWVTYLSKFVKRYGETEVERARELFENAVELVCHFFPFSFSSQVVESSFCVSYMHALLETIM